MNEHDAERSRRVAAIVGRALELDPSARGTYFDRACAGDAELRREVETLAQRATRAADFLEQPAAVVAAPLLAQSLAASPVMPAGTVLGPYRVAREVGRGGAASVYLAEDRRLGRTVAVKVLDPGIAASVGRRRFVREIELAARLQHPHILPVFDAGDTEGRLWYVMPYVAGESLRHRLARERQLPVPEAVRIAREVALALDYAHRQDIVHRDIKPANILLADGQALVADFGIARALQAEADVGLTETGLAIGTPAYMSPEQCAGERALDGRSDIYSLGCVLYEMLAGQPPFTGPSAQALLARRLTERAPRLSALRSLPPHIERTVARALEPAAEDRFQTAHDFALNLDPPAVDQPGPAAQAGDRSRLRGSRVRMGVVLSALFLALSLGYALHARRPRASHEVGPAVPAGIASGEKAPAAVRSIAVLPLVNVGGDLKDEYFSDGMTDELAGALSKVPGLRVASRTSAFTFKGRKDVDVRTIGRQLNVGTVLEGAVLRAGARIRISTQLASAGDGMTLWSNTYERDLKDVFQIQAEVATAVAGALRITLGGEQGLALAPDRTTSLEAHDLYLQGLFYFNRYTEPDLRRSLDLFQRALSHDWLYAPAFVGTSVAWAFLTDDWLAPKEGYPRAERAARQALELDSTAANAYIALALPLINYRWDFAAGEAALRRAIAINPDFAAFGFYGDYLARRGRLDDAEVQFREALQLDPLSSPLHASISRLFLVGGRLDEAVDQGRQSVALEPSYASSHFALGEAYRVKGMLTEALAEYGRAGDLGWRGAQVGQALTLAKLGRATEARRLVRALEEESTRRYVAPDWIAVIYAALGDRETAFRWLERTLETHSLWGIWVAMPDWDPIRRDPRFDAILRRMGLVQ